MKKLTEQERLDFAADMENRLLSASDAAVLGVNGLAAVKAQIALLRDLRIPMFLPTEAEAVEMAPVVLGSKQRDGLDAGASSLSSDFLPTEEQIEDMKAKNADMVSYLQKATGHTLAPINAATALAIADSLILEPATRSFHALMDAWSDCPSLHDFANMVTDVFLDRESDPVRRSRKPAPRLH
jgi:hypothetical protein